MKLYLNEPAPWELKLSHYSQIKLGDDVNKQAENIKRAIYDNTKGLIATQLASTNAIIASQEFIKEFTSKEVNQLGGIISYGFDEIVHGLEGLQAAFEWGIADVVWQLEQNREELRKIVDILSKPLDTQAKELRKRAEEAYGYGWIEESLEDFLQSEVKNKYDFSVQISIGMIYLFHKINKEKALEYFDKAIKYSKQKSPYHASIALMHKALIKRDYGQIEDSEKCTAEAIELSPNLVEAKYQNALYKAMLGYTDEVVNILKEIIKIDINYCLKIDKEEVFDKIRDKINKIFEEIRDENITNVENALLIFETEAKLFDGFEDLKEIEKKMSKAYIKGFYDDWLGKYNQPCIHYSHSYKSYSIPIEKIKNELNFYKRIHIEIHEQIKNNSLYDAIFAKEKLQNAQINKILKSCKENLKDVLINLVKTLHFRAVKYIEIKNFFYYSCFFDALWRALIYPLIFFAPFGALVGFLVGAASDFTKLPMKWGTICGSVFFGVIGVIWIMFDFSKKEYFGPFSEDKEIIIYDDDWEQERSELLKKLEQLMLKITSP